MGSGVIGLRVTKTWQGNRRGEVILSPTRELKVLEELEVKEIIAIKQPHPAFIRVRGKIDYAIFHTARNSQVVGPISKEALLTLEAKNVKTVGDITSLILAYAKARAILEKRRRAGCGMQPATITTYFMLTDGIK